MAEPPSIPPRTSSKRTFAELKRDHPSLLSLRDACNKDLTTAYKKLKPAGGSFDSLFWNNAKTASQIELNKVKYVMDIDRYDFLQHKGTEDDWDLSSRKQNLEAREKALAHKVVTLGSHAERLDTEAQNDQLLASRRAFVSMFVSSKLGLDISSSSIKRDSSHQSNFRNNLIEKMDLKGIDSRSEQVWDVILGEWVSEHQVCASHLFASRHGSVSMASIFGIDVQNELFSARNGLVLSNNIEDNLESGFFAIVPDLADDATEQQRSNWRLQEPKEYKIRFIDKPYEDTGSPSTPAKGPVHRYNKYLGQSKHWRDLDGKKLQFRNDFRPRARYLYFLFVLNMLRYAWGHRGNVANIIDKEIGQQFWGSPGAYVKKGMLQAFVEELGHDLGPCLQNTVVEDPKRSYADGDDALMGEAITSQLLIRTNDPEDEDESDDESDDENEDFGNPED